MSFTVSFVANPVISVCCLEDFPNAGLIGTTDSTAAKGKQFSEAAMEEQTAAGGAVTAGRCRRRSSSAAADAKLRPRRPAERDY